MYSALKKVYIVAYKFLFNFCYQLGNKLKKHQDEKAVFVLSRTNTLQGNLKFMHEELKRQYPKVNIHLIRTENRMNFNLFKELKTINNAQYLILDDYYLPVYLIKPSKRLKVIQLWHAAGAFKKFGHSTIGTKFGPSKDYLNIVPIHSNYTHVYVSSTKVVPYYAEAFNMDREKIYPLGIPRIDMFYNEKYKKQIFIKLQKKHKNLFEDNEKVNILIAPTYRAEGNYTESELKMSEILTNKNFTICDHIRIMYRPHPYTNKNEIKQLFTRSNIYIVDDFTIND